MRRTVLLCLSIIVIGITLPVVAQEESQNRVAAERLIAKIDVSTLAQASLKVSPDSKRVAYGAKVGNKWFVVVDGKEGKQYDKVVTEGCGRIIFDSSDRFHYFALNGSSIYFVDETIK